MPTPPSQGRVSFSRVFGAIVGIAFLIFNLWSFRHNYLLKHSGVTVQGTVLRTTVMRRRGGASYSVDYAFDAAGKHWEGSGAITSAVYLTLRPGGPVGILYVASDPSISETSDMSHNNVSLLLIGFLGIPISLFILAVNFRGERLPEQYAREVPTHLPTKSSAIPSTTDLLSIAYTVYPVKDMTRARHFYETLLGLKPARQDNDQWIEYLLWDNRFAITTQLGEAHEPSAQAGGRIAFNVQDVDQTVAQLREKGVRVAVEPFSTPISRMAVLLDSEGNAFVLRRRTA